MSDEDAASEASVVLHHGNALDGLATLAPGSVDFVFADLPYGTTANAWDRVLPMERLWPLLDRACKSTAAMVFTAMQPFASMLVASNLRAFRYEVIWHKNRATRFLDAKRRPLLAHESVLVFYRRQPTYHPQKTTGHAPRGAVRKAIPNGSNYGKTRGHTNPGGQTDRYPTTVLDIPAAVHRIHPTQKPVALVEWFLRTFTDPGDLVVDPCAGSATTLVAARNLGRRAVGWETDADYFAKAQQRLRGGQLSLDGAA